MTRLWEDPKSVKSVEDYFCINLKELCEEDKDDLVEILEDMICTIRQCDGNFYSNKEVEMGREEDFNEGYFKALEENPERCS